MIKRVEGDQTFCDFSGNSPKAIILLGDLPPQKTHGSFTCTVRSSSTPPRPLTRCHRSCCSLEDCFITAAPGQTIRSGVGADRPPHTAKESRYWVRYPGNSVLAMKVALGCLSVGEARFPAAITTLDRGTTVKIGQNSPIRSGPHHSLSDGRTSDSCRFHLHQAILTCEWAQDPELPHNRTVHEGSGAGDSEHAGRDNGWRGRDHIVRIELFERRAFV